MIRSKQTVAACVDQSVGAALRNRRLFAVRLPGRQRVVLITELKIKFASTPSRSLLRARAHWLISFHDFRELRATPARGELRREVGAAKLFAVVVLSDISPREYRSSPIPVTQRVRWIFRRRE